jgi:hypothetical protein
LRMRKASDTGSSGPGIIQKINRRNGLSMDFLPE